MSIEWVNGAIEEIRAWGRSKDIVVDADEVRLLCDYASDYLDVGELADFTPGTFEQLLLDIYPRKVIAPPESAAETVAAARTLVDFLLDSGEIGTKMAARMRAKIDEIAPLMPAALADTTKFGMAKSIFGAMGADRPDPTALDAGPTGSGDDPLGLSPHRLRGVTADDGCECPGCAPLPAVRLPPPEEVARAVRRAGLLADAHRLTTWMLDGARTPTVRGALRVRDATRAAKELGVAAPAAAWRLAVDLGLVEVAGTAVSAAGGFRPLEARDDQEVLDLWAATVAFVTDGPAGVTGAAEFDQELYAVHDMLYRLRAPMTLDELREHLEETWPGGEDPGELDSALAVLASCGTVERVEDAIRLTPQGLWGMRETFIRMGMPAPVAPDPAEGDAAGLVDGLLSGVAAEQAELDIAAWLARRSPPEAARELLDAVRGQSAARRGVAVTIIDRLGAEAGDAVRPFLDEPELRPHAAGWLAARGLDAPPLTPEEVLWLSVDTLAHAMPAAEHDPGRFAESLTTAGPAAHTIEEMWQVEHPDVAEVLDLLGRHLPDREVAKAARKAAFKARSRGIR
ncbi:hypothetical protein Sme01_61120 [Sphaerisporangium melleum]|uniref:Uncharacterized protein n=1 Tax=Sphaerisporangium melleum TaxID=321316 RepID=A0A917RAL0_9ACTN|nr:hypothetical protein [Sphaerisporangium melleum]GGK97513.1 hypothetical protein GCM10007964_44740 [Sphaerisporangium melleum]GII73636.1 hypothetical protein Sme01_61120 [Sphaerisporangium melleum]